MILFPFVFDNWWPGGIAAENTIAKDAPPVANTLGEEFYRVILREEPFASTKVNYKIKFSAQLTSEMEMKEK